MIRDECSLLGAEMRQFGQYSDMTQDMTVSR
jgi:hypothetical protein